MLTAFKQKSRTITKSERKGNALYLYSEHGTHRITPVTEEILHAEYTTEEDFRDKLSPGIVNNNSLAEWTFSVNGDCVELKTLKLVIVEMSKGNMIFDIIALINADVITFEDLEDFSDELKEQVKFIISR